MTIKRRIRHRNPRKGEFGNFHDKIRKIKLAEPEDKTKTVVIYCDASACDEKKFSAIAVTVIYKQKRIKTFSKVYKTLRFGELYAIFEALKEATKYKNNLVVIYNDCEGEICSIKKSIFLGKCPRTKKYTESRKRITNEIIKLLKENKNIWIRKKRRNEGEGMKVVDNISRKRMKREKKRRRKQERVS